MIQAIKQRMVEECPVRPGDQVLDVGCGLGHELQRLAAQVGPEGHVVGIDVNTAMVAEARRRAIALDLPIVIEVGDAHALGFEDYRFDLCRVERVLRYLERPETAVREMTRVARRGGIVLAFDFDSDQTVVDAPDRALTTRIAQVLDDAVPNPWIGRRLFGLLRRIGLADVRVVPHAICLTGSRGLAMYRQLNEATITGAQRAEKITADEVDAWWRAVEEAGRTESFFLANVGFIATGRKR